MFSKELAVAEDVANRAGALLKKREQIHIDSAIGKDIKLSSDRLSEELIINELSAFGYTIISEEIGVKDCQTDLCWIIDPLDGTMNYANGLDELTCVSIALWKKSKPIFGVIYRYAVDEMFIGVVGEGAWLNKTPILPSTQTSVSQAVLGTGFPVLRNYDDESLKAFIVDAQRYKKVRMLGSAALMCVSVACGRLDAYKEENVRLWDVAAAIAIVKASGGVCELQQRENYQCLCECYANDKLMTNAKRGI